MSSCVLFVMLVTYFLKCILEKECGWPSNGTNADISEVSGTVYQDVVRYKCHPGYNYYHSYNAMYYTTITKRCLSNGKWGSPPTCNSKHINGSAHYLTTFSSSIYCGCTKAASKSMHFISEISIVHLYTYIIPLQLCFEGIHVTKPSLI